MGSPWSMILVVKYNLTSDGPIKIKYSYWSKMAPSPLVTFSNQNPLVEYISLYSNSGGANQGMASLSTKKKKERQKNWKTQILPSKRVWSNGRGRSQSQQKISSNIRTYTIHSQSVLDSKQMLQDFKERENSRMDVGLGLGQCSWKQGQIGAILGG